MGQAAEDLEFLESLRQDFIEETLENLQKSEECLLRFERDKCEDHIREYLRLLHSIKGSARAVEFDKIGTTIHQIETMGHKKHDPLFVEISLSLIDDLRDVLALIKENNYDAMELKLEAAIKKTNF